MGAVGNMSSRLVGLVYWLAPSTKENAMEDRTLIEKLKSTECGPKCEFWPTCSSGDVECVLFTLSAESITRLLDRAEIVSDIPTEELRELAEAWRDGRLAVLPSSDYVWSIRGDIMKNIITANCRAEKGEKNRK